MKLKKLTEMKREEAQPSEGRERWKKEKMGARSRTQAPRDHPWNPILRSTNINYGKRRSVFPNSPFLFSFQTRLKREKLGAFGSSGRTATKGCERTELAYCGNSDAMNSKMMILWVLLWKTLYPMNSTKWNEGMRCYGSMKILLSPLTRINIKKYS